MFTKPLPVSSPAIVLCMNSLIKARQRSSEVGTALFLSAGEEMGRVHPRVSELMPEMDAGNLAPEPVFT